MFANEIEMNFVKSLEISFVIINSDARASFKVFKNERSPLPFGIIRHMFKHVHKIIYF